MDNRVATAKAKAKAKKSNNTNSCGSGLARDGSTLFLQIERGACIAGKPGSHREICRSQILHSNRPAGRPPRRLLIYPPHREAEWRFCASGPERGNLSAAKAVLRSSATTGKQLIRVHIRHLRLSGIWFRPCGSRACPRCRHLGHPDRTRCLHRGQARLPQRRYSAASASGKSDSP